MVDLTRQLTERYDREAAAYFELWAPILRVASVKLLPRLGGGHVRRVVDVGAGVGALLPDLAQAFPGARVTGVDCSRGMLRLAPASFDRAAMDAGRLALRSQAMDLVLMVFMLFHLPSPLDGLREARRVIRRGGQVAALTWGGELESPATRAWSACLDAHGAEPADPASAARHEAVDSPEKMEALLFESGFEAPRCWVEELVYRLDPGHLLRLRTSLGAAKARFDSLASDRRAACLARARRQFETMSDEDFVVRGRIVYAIGRT